MTEAVGAWSMVDVFLVGLLAGLVKLGLVATIEPGIGATFFAGAVILTMLAAHNFDPRIIWDRALGTNHNLDSDSDSDLKADDKNSSHIQVIN
jgi:uncharacterized paraquat-inducible protein A